MRLIAEGSFHQMIRANLHVVFVVLTCGMWMNCAVASETRRPSVLWIMLGDCRADALGCYGRRLSPACSSGRRLFA
jgi:hypothetical protein